LNCCENTTPRKALTEHQNQRRIDLVVGNKQEQMMTTEFKIDGLEEYLDHIRMNYIQWVKPEDDDSWKQQRCKEVEVKVEVAVEVEVAIQVELEVEV
jgi:hypothetical protein